MPSRYLHLTTHITENNKAHLRCNQTEVINVTKAVYGQYVCDNTPKTCNNITDSLQKVRDECQGRQRCNFTVNNGFIGGDPCKTFIKQLYVEYECVIKQGILLHQNVL